MLDKELKTFLQVTPEINEICHSLKKIGIHLFSYRRCFTDGSRINFSNNADWLLDYYKLNLYQSSLFEKSISSYSTGFSLWPQESSLAVFLHGRQYYNSDNGITYVINYNEYCDFFIFGADKNNKQIINFYINNLDLLKNFSGYFYNQTKKIIAVSAKNRIYLPERAMQSDIGKYVYRQNITNFKNNIMLNLSNREKSCLYGILAGQTAKQIAGELNLTFRTVEYYIENLKKKMGCRRRSEIFNRFFL
ncbi:MAG: LuxR family transcriptional regulator [Gammaproteobacteria bacterium]